MEETYNLKAIILNRRPFGEDDGRILIYSLERGKLDLVARGVKKIKSKLAGHLEPFTLADIMAVRGRQYDYLGAAASQNCYFHIKKDLAKIEAAGQVIKIFEKSVKPGLADRQIFDLLSGYLEILNSKKIDPEILNYYFFVKLLGALGQKPELYHCVNCGVKIMPTGRFKFNLAGGGLVCGRCPVKQGLTISVDCLKILRFIDKEGLEKIVKLKISDSLKRELVKLVSSFFKYNNS